MKTSTTVPISHLICFIEILRRVFRFWEKVSFVKVTKFVFKLSRSSKKERWHFVSMQNMIDRFSWPKKNVRQIFSDLWLKRNNNNSNSNNNKTFLVCCDKTKSTQDGDKEEEGHLFFEQIQIRTFFVNFHFHIFLFRCRHRHRSNRYPRKERKAEIVGIRFNLKKSNNVMIVMYSFYL